MRPASGLRAAAVRPQAYALAAAVLCLLGAAASCGGAAGGHGPAGAGRGLALMSANVDGIDNVPLNAVLVLDFSEPVAPASIHAGSVQVREGPSYGLTVSGTFRVDGARVTFEPELPGVLLDPDEPPDCDLTRAGLKPGTLYRVTLVGQPEFQPIANTRGQPLDGTQTVQFRTRTADDPRVLEDADPEQAPAVLSSTPADGAASVPVGSALRIGAGPLSRYEGAPDRIQLEFTENLHPCSVHQESVQVHVHEHGDPGAGFVPAQDAAPQDPYSWGAPSAEAVSPPRRVPCRLQLEQTSGQTLLTLTPVFGRFPENALVVVDLSPDVLDFGGNRLQPTHVAFTTANRLVSAATLRLEYDESTPIDPDGRTAQVHLPRAPSRAQGFLNVAGDGDNGPDLVGPAYPAALDGSSCDERPDDGFDHFLPIGTVLLDTGATPNPCRNHVDGSNAVVFEFASFAIHAGVTVRLVGVNPAIILVTGDVLIDKGGVLDVSGAPGAHGVTSYSAYGLPWPSSAKGGAGVAGGGDGGSSQAIAEVHPNPAGAYGGDGWSGYGSPDHPVPAEGGHGAGLGGSAAGFIGPFPTYGTSGAGGGGGGHTLAGSDGGRNLGVSNGWLAPTAGAEAGGGYPNAVGADQLVLPSAGSGGGAGGYCDCVAGPTGHRPGCTASGGAGGGGGGFVDLTSGTGITVYGTIDASGGRGGNGGVSFYVDIGDAGGGGGGSGGGVRLLTPGDIDVTGGTITAAGGAGGSGFVSTLYGGAPPNDGGHGSSGRVVMEDADGLIEGQGSATIVPFEGEPGFFRGVFQETRFRGGGPITSATTRPLFLGPLSATSLRVPEEADFIAGVPAAGSRGPGATAILVEIRGFPARPDGTMDATSGTGWWTVGHFRDTGSVERPAWWADANPSDVPLPVDNLGTGIEHVDGMGYVQVRLTFYLPTGVAVGQPGPYVDRFDLRIDYDDL